MKNLAGWIVLVVVALAGSFALVDAGDANCRMVDGALVCDEGPAPPAEAVQGGDCPCACENCTCRTYAAQVRTYSYGCVGRAYSYAAPVVTTYTYSAPVVRYTTACVGHNGGWYGPIRGRWAARRAARFGW